MDNVEEVFGTLGNLVSMANTTEDQNPNNFGIITDAFSSAADLAQSQNLSATFGVSLVSHNYSTNTIPTNSDEFTLLVVTTSRYLLS